jgi:hypothetical protein
VKGALDSEDTKGDAQTVAGRTFPDDTPRAGVNAAGTGLKPSPVDPRTEGTVPVTSSGPMGVKRIGQPDAPDPRMHGAVGGVPAPDGSLRPVQKADGGTPPLGGGTPTPPFAADPEAPPSVVGRQNLGVWEHTTGQFLSLVKVGGSEPYIEVYNSVGADGVPDGKAAAILVLTDGWVTDAHKAP